MRRRMGSSLFGEGSKLKRHKSESNVNETSWSTWPKRALDEKKNE